MEASGEAVWAPTSLAAGSELAGRWLVTRKIGQGSFGSVYSATSTADGTEAALKVEARNVSAPVLGLEAWVLWSLRGSRFFPRLLDSGTRMELNWVAMELLGPSLGRLKRAAPSQVFSVATTLGVAVELLGALEELHGVGVVHRDLKPANVVTGRKESGRIVLLDMGLSRRFVDGAGRVAAARASAGFRGTVRYASPRSHRKEELGPGDDVVSVLYALSEFGTGRLPWRHVHGKREVEKLKLRATPKDLFPTPLPPILADILRHAGRLHFNETPPYALYKDALREVIRDRGYESRPFDWELPNL